ncbi:exosome complex subunit [Grosmannia clavigera kw1407]|uniref:Exosome complex subunit n=1 Tax=Grosmannia clavigera (strain kw1407 / UAMH 11150) TaxID=655863 RepID=F0XHE3_GROCL|nr:exosome complex subunit [Grosmannia clavigera kw1407]EFX03110.1 exosome complex subunit [Grosmannia clavigera kw1407]
MTAPELQARLATLPRADGSATYSHGGYTVTASANGPIEAQRRDEDPDAANIDVVVRPAAGVGGPSERNHELILQKTLQDIVLVQEFPRCTIQVVLQIQSAPENDYANTKLNQPGLAAVLALLSASIPMRTIATAAAVAIMPGSIISSPSPRDAAAAQSLHVFAFSGQDDKLLLAESEGAFTMEEWDNARTTAGKICCGLRAGISGSSDKALDEEHGTEATVSMHDFVRSTVVHRAEDVLQWKLDRK